MRTLSSRMCTMDSLHSLVVLVTAVCMALPSFVNSHYSEPTPPIILSQTHHYSNHMTSIACNASGDPPLSYNWYRNDVELQNESGAELKLQHYSGVYHCIASNPWGHVRSDNIPYQATDCTKKYSRIHERVIAMAVPHGGSVLLPCDHITCSYQPKVEWTVNGTVITRNVAGDKEPGLVITSNGSLFVSSVTEEATYQCKATEIPDDISVYGANFEVKIDDSAPVNPHCMGVDEHQSVTVVKGDDYSIDCLCPGSVLWILSNGTQIEKHVVDLTDIISQSKNTSHTYTCTVDDVKRKQIDVTVEERPKMKDAMKEQLRTPSNKDAIFKCIADGTDINIQWYFNGHAISGKISPYCEVSKDKNDQILRLRNFIKMPNGTFLTGTVQCNASNAHGYLWSSARLTVIDAGSMSTPETFIDEVNKSTKPTTSPTALSTSTSTVTSVQATSSNAIHASSSMKPVITAHEPASSSRVRDTTTASFPQSTATSHQYNLTVPQIVLIAVIPVSILVCGVCIGLYINRLTVCGVGRSQNTNRAMGYAPSNQSDNQSTARVDMRQLQEIPLEATVLLGNPYTNYRQAPSLPHSDSGVAESHCEQDLGKHQLMHRYLMEAGHYAQTHQYGGAPSVASSQGLAPNYAAAPVQSYAAAPAPNYAAAPAPNYAAAPAPNLTGQVLNYAGAAAPNCATEQRHNQIYNHNARLQFEPSASAGQLPHVSSYTAPPRGSESSVSIEMLPHMLSAAKSCPHRMEQVCQSAHTSV